MDVRKRAKHSDEMRILKLRNQVRANLENIAYNPLTLAGFLLISMGIHLPDEESIAEALRPGGAESAGGDLGSAVRGEIGRRFELNGVRGEVGDVAASQALGSLSRRDTV
jgi:hypothetical protein